MFKLYWEIKNVFLIEVKSTSYKIFFWGGNLVGEMKIKLFEYKNIEKYRKLLRLKTIKMWDICWKIEIL